MKRVVFVFILTALMMAGCVSAPTYISTVSTTSASPTIPRAIGTIAPTKLPTQHVTLTDTPIPSDTPSPALRMPHLVWADAFDDPIEVEGFTGIWSPTSNEIVGIERSSFPGETQDLVGTLTLANAPTFAKICLDKMNKGTAYRNMTWSVDGQEILYGVSESQGTIGVDYYSNIWMVSRNGSNPHPLFPNDPNQLFRGLNFLGWMESGIIAYAGYMGGGHFQIEEYDFLTQEVLVEDIVRGAGQPSSTLIPIVGCEFTCTTCVLTRQQAPEGSHACGSEQGYTRPFPWNDLDPLTTEAFFQGWYPGTNDILILTQAIISDTRFSRLVLWDVDTDIVTPYVLGGLSGQFSPNGRVLAFVTLGLSDQYSREDVRDTSLDPIPADNEPYLQIMDTETQQILLRTLVKVHIDALISNIGMIKATELSFSPDSRYVLFVTDGPARLENAHRPTEAALAKTEQTYLNVLDLDGERITQSLPLDDFPEYIYIHVSWSPDSTKLVYQDGKGNWHLVDLAQNVVSPITLEGGNQIDAPAWSYDGSYLSFSSHFYIDTAIIQTYIFNLGTHP